MLNYCALGVFKMNGIFVIIVGILFCMASLCLSYNDPVSTPRSRMRLITTRRQQKINTTAMMKRELFTSSESSTECNYHRGEEILYPDMMPGNQVKKEQQQCFYNICWNVEDYPTNKVQKIINESTLLQSFFNTSDIEESVVQFDNRFGEDDESLCSVQRKTLFPEKARNIKNEEKFIFNLKQERQGVFVEACVNKDAQCRFSDKFPEGYITKCEQKFAMKRLLVLKEGGKGDEHTFDTFEFPSCCQCQIKINQKGGKT